MATTVAPAVLTELQAWKSYRDAHPNGNGADPATYNGDNLSPAAQQYAVGRYDPTTGGPANGLNGQHFDVNTGQIVDNGGAWKLPETYGILAAAGLVGGAGAAGALGGGGAAAGGGINSAAAPLEAGSFPGVTSGLGSASGAFDAAGNFIGDSTVDGAVGSGLGASTLKSILGTVGSVGSGLGAAGSGAANARYSEALINQRQDALAQSGYLNALQGANTDLNQKKFALAAPAQRESNAAKGDILANAKDFSYGAPTMVGNIPVPSSSGGLQPSIFSDSTKALGALVPKQQLAGQQAGDQFAPLPQVPQLTPLPSPGVTSGILNTAGTVGNLANLLKNVPGAVSWLG